MEEPPILKLLKARLPLPVMGKLLFAAIGAGGGGLIYMSTVTNNTVNNPIVTNNTVSNPIVTNNVTINVTNPTVPNPTVPNRLTVDTTFNDPNITNRFNAVDYKVLSPRVRAAALAGSSRSLTPR